MVLQDKIVKALENVEFIIGIYLDFSEAFDTADHSILLMKLQCCRHIDVGNFGLSALWLI